MRDVEYTHITEVNVSRWKGQPGYATTLCGTIAPPERLIPIGSADLQLTEPSETTCDHCARIYVIGLEMGLLNAAHH